MADRKRDAGQAGDAYGGDTGRDELARANAILDALPDLLFVVDVEGRIFEYRAPDPSKLYVNPTQFLGRLFREVLPEDVSVAIEAALRGALEHGVHRGTTYFLDLPDERRWFELSIARTKHEESGTPRFVVLVRDITERKAAEVALRESEQLYTSLVETAHDFVWRCDESGRYVFVNRACERVLGYSVEEMIGRPFTDFMAPAQAKADLALFQGMMASEQGVFDYETVHLRKDGAPVHLSFNARVILDDQGRVMGTQGSAQDISRRKRAQQARAELEAQIRRKQKLESLGVLAGGIAHDFNNLLTVIRGNIDLIRLDLPAGSELSPLAEEIEQVSERAADLCQQMLAYAGKGRLFARRVDLTAEIESMRGMLGATLSKKATLTLDLAKPLPAVQADPTQVQQIVMNLAVNASEALEGQGGEIRLTTASITLPEDLERVPGLHRTLPAGGYVLLEVSDTGCGMDEETRERIFDPFFSTKFVGRGLGLAAVEGIVRTHGGSIAVHTEPGRGSRMGVVLPAVAGAEDALEAPRPSATAPTEGGLVLLVDDEEAVRISGRRMLSRLGYDVLTAADGGEALVRFTERRDEIHCVLLDLTMPVLDGAETLRRLRALDADLPVILCSGYDRREVAAWYAELGPSAFVQKPYELESLRNALRHATKGPR